MCNISPLTDRQDDYPAGYDATGAEIWPGEHTVVYEGKELVLENFKAEISALISSDSGAIDLARALDLDITRYD